ncbi:unnamed protein product, partial [Brenthis ino]
MTEAAPEMQETMNQTDDSKSSLEEIKHPLEHTWSFWMFTNEKRTWEDNLVKLTTFSTVEDYWCLYHHMKVPSELALGQDYAIFKNNIRPMWEDAANIKGGRWLISFDKKRNINMDNIWLFVILLLIGENFEHSHVISGAVVNVRVKSKIGVWISDLRNKAAIMEIGQKLKDQLGIHGRINFHKHNSTDNLYTI